MGTVTSSRGRNSNSNSMVLVVVVGLIQSKALGGPAPAQCV